MPFDPDQPYNDLPLLPSKAELESKAVLRNAIAANKALAELKGAGELIPNQSVLIHATGLQEVKLSSEIENVVTTNDELAVRSLDVHMFVKQTYCENMSKKADFLDICQKHVQDVGRFFGGTREFFWRDINIAPKKSSIWRNSIIAPHKVLRGEGRRWNTS